MKLEKYQENGLAYPFKLSSQFSQEKFLSEYFDFQKKSEEIFKKKASVKPNLLSVFFDKLATDESIISKVKKVIGEDIYIWSSAFFCKAPGEGKIVSYHQDNPYWQLTTDKVVTAWIALTNSDKNSGALEIVPKSHKIGLINKLDVDNPRESYLQGKKTTPSNDLLSYNQNLENFIKENPPVVVELKPGEFSLHHVNAVHGSGINNSKNYRIGFAVRYVSSDTKHKMENNDSAIHISGKKSNYFTDEIRPDLDFSKNAIEAYQKAMGAAGSFGNKKY